MLVYSASVMWSLMLEEVSTNLLLIFLGVLVVVKVSQQLKENMSLPPGPWGLPIFGSMYSRNGMDLHLYFKDLTQKYGSVICTKLGAQVYVVVSDYKMIRDLFRKEEFTGRPATEFNNVLEGYGIINTEGKLWKDQRRFLHDGLRQFGMSYLGSRKAQMEARISTEVEEFLAVLKPRQNEALDLNPYFAVPISNVICDVLMSVKFSHNDKRFIRFMNLIDEGFRLFGSLEAALFVPALKYLPWNLAVLNKITRNRDEMAVFFQETIDEHRKTFDRSHMRDLLDTYLYEIEKAKEEGMDVHLFEGKNHDRQMQQIMGDLFSAGMETVKNSLQWCVLFMLHNPEHMMAVQEELDQVVGRHRLPKLEDLAYLPVTESTILEVLRISSIVPMGTTHAPIRDTKLNGFRLPRKTHIVPLLHSVHMDPTLWNEPEKFNPNRFINNEGKVHKPEYFLPFGVGRRMCLGEVLARMEIFLFFASLLHTFDVRVPEGESLPSLKGIAGVTIVPSPFKVTLKQRPMKWESEDCSKRPAGSH